MEIEEINKKLMYFVMQRCKEKGIEMPPEISFIHLTEELGEVARQLSNKQI